jgi:hypothetical protein
MTSSDLIDPSGVFGVPHETGDIEVAGQRALAAAFAGTGRVSLVGGGERAARLAAARPERFVLAEGISGGPAGRCKVLALALDEETLALARDLARSAGARGAFVLVDRDADSTPPDGVAVRERLRAAGLVVSGTERILWQTRAGGVPAAVSRAERLEAETRLLLLRCVLADDPRALDELEQAVADLQRRLDLAAQVEVDHARTREAERARAQRLQELEEAALRIGSADLLGEVERLRAEIQSMRATRVWRLGARWWRFRDRLRRAG